MKIQKKQEGFVLIVCIVLLAMMMLMAGTMINMNTAEQKINYNAKVMNSLKSSSVQAIERTLTDITNFTSPSEKTYDINGYTITVSAPECLGSRIVGGNSARSGLSKEDTFWSLTASAEDPNSGARMSIKQGVRITMLANNCL